MLDILGKIVLGAIVGAAAVGVTYSAYKIITKETAKEDITKVIQEQPDTELFQRAFKAKYMKQKEDAFSFDILDEWDEPLTNVDLEGDEISSDIKIGDVIYLY